MIIPIINNEGYYYESETPVVNVMDHGALGNGTTDDTNAIKTSMSFAKTNGIATVYFPAGIYSIQQIGTTQGIIPLLNGVSLKGDGPTLTHIVLSGGRQDPNSIFGQVWQNEPTVSNVIVDGIHFDGNLATQTVSTTDYQFCHALSINNGANIEIKNCKFEAFRGDGLLFGDVFLSSLNLRTTFNVSVHNNEFVDIYREGCMFCCSTDCTFTNNLVHGDGYLVGGVDIERHSMNEQVTNITVANNTFDFRDGLSPVERGTQTQYRRAITMGFFYDHYTGGVADGLASGHSIQHNTIYEGQIDCWGHTNVTISDNTITNIAGESIDGANHVSLGTIDIQDADVTTGLINVFVNNNVITSNMENGIGIQFNRYNGVTANTNTITGTEAQAINIVNAGGTIDSNIIQDVGTIATHISGIIINGTTPNLLVTANNISNTTTGGSRTTSNGIFIGSTNAASPPPTIAHNRGVNLLGTILVEFPGQTGYVNQSDNTST